MTPLGCVPATPSLVTVRISTPVGHDWEAHLPYGHRWAKCKKCGVAKHSVGESGWGMSIKYFPRGGGESTTMVGCIGYTYATCTVRLTNGGGGGYTIAANDLVFAQVGDETVTYHNTTGGALNVGPGTTLDVSVECDLAGSGGSAAISGLALVTGLNGVTATNTTAAVGLDEESPSAIVDVIVYLASYIGGASAPDVALVAPGRPCCDASNALKGCVA